MTKPGLEPGLAKMKSLWSSMSCHLKGSHNEPPGGSQAAPGELFGAWALFRDLCSLLIQAGSDTLRKRVGAGAGNSMTHCGRIKEDFLRPEPGPLSGLRGSWPLIQGPVTGLPRI